MATWHPQPDVRKYPVKAFILTDEFKPILPYKPPLVLGHDLAGTVAKVGAGVRRFKPGDAVSALLACFLLGLTLIIAGRVAGMTGSLPSHADG